MERGIIEMSCIFMEARSTDAVQYQIFY